LYGFLEPGFKCTGRIEDQFPNIMKELGYPFSISKAAMSAIGTPHTWPNLLAALDWLREEIQVGIKTQVFQLFYGYNYFVMWCKSTNLKTSIVYEDNLLQLINIIP